MPAISLALDRNRPESLLSTVVTLDVIITAIHDGLRHKFDFDYCGKECYCFVNNWRELAGQTLEVGEIVKITGTWSSAILRVFEANVVIA